MNFQNEKKNSKMNFQLYPEKDPITIIWNFKPYNYELKG